MTAIERRAKEASERMRLRCYDTTADAIDELLSAHAKCKRELAEARKVVRLYLPLGSKEAMKYWAKKAGVKQEEKR